MKYYPIAVRLKNNRAVVVGGGNVAERKVASLLEARARVDVVSPELTDALKALAGKKRIRWARRHVKQDDIARADIVIAATSDKKVNKSVSLWARRSGKPVNVVDDQALSEFISPSVIRRANAIIAVYTDGKDPVLSRDLRIFLEGQWDEFLSFRDRL